MNETCDLSGQSQIEPSEKIRNFVEGTQIATSADLVDLKIRMRYALRIIPYDSSTEEQERRSRWTRSAAKIFEDGFIFSRYSCTDLIILFMGLCSALGFETRFVKVKKEYPEMHSILEIKLADDWYIYDLADNNYPEKGEIKPHVIYRGWYLYRKGRDSWDLGLCEYDDMYKLWQEEPRVFSTLGGVGKKYDTAVSVSLIAPMPCRVRQQDLPASRENPYCSLCALTTADVHDTLHPFPM